MSVTQTCAKGMNCVLGHFIHCQADVPGTTWANEMNFMNHDSGAGSLSRSVP